MSAQSRQELVLALRGKYLNASWSEKKKLLDGLVTATGYDRKYAVTLLSKGINKKQGKRNRQKIYDGAVIEALSIVWKAANRICSKRLIPFMPSLVDSLTRFKHLDISETVQERLLSMSAATADRLLYHERRKYGGKGKSTTKPGYLIKKLIPIRTFADWNDVTPGFLEVDLVAHCGETTRGRYLNTFTLTDIATGWTELRAIIGKGEVDVLQELDVIKKLLPVPLLGLDTDNGGEFANWGMIDWCVNNSVTFTHSREYKKNDQAHVEEKNGSIVRKLIGYDRYEGLESLELLSHLYGIARLYVNFFQPCVKLVSKKRDGARVHKRYDKAKTPCERMMESPSVAEETKTRLYTTFRSLDPVRLLQEIERAQKDLWNTAVGLNSTPWGKEETIQTIAIIDTSRLSANNCELIEVGTISAASAPTPRRKRVKARKDCSPPKDKVLPSETTDPDVGLQMHAESVTVTESNRTKGLGLADHFENFLCCHLRKNCAAENTVSSYRDSLRLLLQFTQRHLSKEASELDLSVFDGPLISAFLDDLENRGISAGSRNLRLSAIRSFCRYAAGAVPSGMSNLQYILAIPTKKYVRPEVEFLRAPEADAVVAAPDRTTWCGRRDHAFLLVALQTGLLVSEMTRLTVQDLELSNEAYLHVIGDGRKKRRIPLTREVVTLLHDWIKELARSKKKTLFPNARGGRLTDDGVRYILNRHIGAACEVCPSLQVKHVTPFILRHTKAMQLVSSGMNREEIALWLGLESVDSLQTYIKAHFENEKKLIRERESKSK